jgi:hypothetical protein
MSIMSIDTARCIYLASKGRKMMDFSPPTNSFAAKEDLGKERKREMVEPECSFQLEK